LDVKKVALISVLILIISILISFPNHNASTSPTKYSTIIVSQDGSGDYITIQDAIDNSYDGDTIKITSGQYIEQIQIASNISLVGDSKTSVRLIGSGTETGITISSEDGFQIKNLILSGTFYTGIRIDGSRGKILNCKIQNCSYGGIVAFGHQNVVKFNEIYDCERGVVIEGARNLFLNNSVCNNSVDGFHLYDCSNNGISNNLIQNNAIGIENHETVMNTFSNNQIIGNTIQAKTDGSDLWYLTYPGGGNYWSDYVGKDVMKGAHQSISGSDGFGDIPYSIGSSGEKDKYPIFRDLSNPVAYAGEDKIIDSGYSYHFNARGSTDDQLVERVEWSWYWKGEWIEFEEFEFDYRFDYPGIFWINLTVFDYAGNSDTDSMNITVIDITPPIALSQGNIVANQGDLIYFDGTGSSDNGIIAKFSWEITSRDYNPPITFKVYGQTTSTIIEKPGYFSGIMKVADEEENIGEDKFNITIIDLEKPIASAPDDIEINNGEMATFDGSQSDDNGLVLFWNWSFDCDGEIQELSGRVSKFQFDIPGYYEVILTVEDQFGNQNTDTLFVTAVDTISPIARITGSPTVLEGENLQLDGSSSSDNGVISEYKWTFFDADEKELYGEELDYYFHKKGFHVIRLTVTDEWNNSGFVEVKINVDDSTSPIAKAGRDIFILIGTTYQFNGSSSTDDGTIVEWEWSFNYDGQEKRLYGETTEFTFKILGEYKVTLYVTDQYDNLGYDVITITVVDSIDDISQDDDDDDSSTIDDNTTDDDAGLDDDDDIIVNDNETDEKDLIPPIIIALIGVILVITIILIVLFLYTRRKKTSEDIIRKTLSEDNTLDQMGENSGDEPGENLEFTFPPLNEEGKGKEV